MGKKFLVAGIVLIFISSMISISFLQYSFENDFDYVGNDLIMALIFIVFPFIGGIFLFWKYFQTRKPNSNTKNKTYTDYSKNDDDMHKVNNELDKSMNEFRNSSHEISNMLANTKMHETPDQ